MKLLFTYSVYKRNSGDCLQWRVIKALADFPVSSDPKDLDSIRNVIKLLLSRIIYLFSSNMHDASLSMNIHTTCTRLMLNLADYLSEFHSNTHIPVVIESQMRYEVTGDPLYKDIGIFFMDILNSSHSYATGGTSYVESWTDPKRLADTLGSENEESCTTYNILKVSRHLFRWTKEMAYAYYYERALTNGVLSIQRGTYPVIMIYMLPLRRGVSKAVSYHGWGTQFDSFWCCYGTGIESFSKLGDSVYLEEEENTLSMYIIKYISNSFNWGLGNISLRQEVENIVSSDPHLRVSFTFTSNKGVESAVKFRIPLWTGSNGAKETLNGQDISLPSPGNFLSVLRKWSSGDKLTLDLPLTFRTEAIKGLIKINTLNSDLLMMQDKQ